MTKKKKEEKNKGGRPTIMTKDVIAKLEHGFKIGLNNTECCAYAEISRDALYDYTKKYPEFSDKITAWKRNPIAKAKAAVFKGLDDPKLALEYLKLRDEDFSTKIKQEVTNNIPQIVVANETVKSKIEMLMNNANNN